MKAVLNKTEPIYYISESKIVEFISENAPMEWNKCCNFVREINITSDETGGTYWCKENLVDEKDYNPEAFKWITAFFETHPWINKMMVVFDD